MMNETITVEAVPKLLSEHLTQEQREAALMADAPELLALLQDDAERGSNATLTVDLQAQTISGPDGGTVHFDIDPSRKQILLEGLDDIAGTLKSDSAIASFEGKMAQNRPWL